MTTDRPANPWQRFRRKVRDHGPLYAALLMLNHVVPRSLLDVKVWVVSSTDLSTFIDAESPAARVLPFSSPSSRIGSSRAGDTFATTA